MKTRVLWTFSLVAIMTLASVPAWADFTFSFLPINTFSGSGTTGTLTAKFSDLTAAGTCGGAGAVGNVCLVITSSLAAGENLDPDKALYLNVTPAKADLAGYLTGLTFALESNVGFAQAASVQVGDDSFKADGTGGDFDLLFTYTSSTKAFTTGESQTYLITAGVGTITTNDFLNLSGDALATDSCNTGATAADHTCFDAAVHVQNVSSSSFGGTFPGGGGGIIQGTVPEPKSVLISLIGFGLIVLVNRRRRQTA